MGKRKKDHCCDTGVDMKQYFLADFWDCTIIVYRYENGYLQLLDNQGLWMGGYSTMTLPKQLREIDFI